MTKMKITAGELSIKIPIVVHGKDDLDKMVEHYLSMINTGFPIHGLSWSISSKEIEVDL